MPDFGIESLVSVQNIIQDFVGVFSVKCHKNLCKLGLESYPKFNWWLFQISIDKKYHFRQTVPKFLFKIYKRLSEKDDEINEDGLRRSHRSYLHDFNESDGITTEHARIIENSDIIMTFLNNRKWISIDITCILYPIYFIWLYFFFKKKGMHLQ